MTSKYMLEGILDVWNYILLVLLLLELEIEWERW